MPATSVIEKDFGNGFTRVAVGLFNASETGSMDWTRFGACYITAQLSGTATAVTAIIERSSTDPSLSAGASTAPADSTGITGNLSTGVPPNIYQETSVGWWRIRLSSSSGGVVTSVLSGVGT